MSTEREKLLLEELEHSELTRDDDLPEQLGRRRGASGVYSLRLPAEAVEELESLSRRLDVPASAIARGFVLAGLEEAKSPMSAGTLLKLVEGNLRQLKLLLTASD